VTVEVIGHQFWWEIRYPDSGVVTANEITIPAGEPVRLLLRSADVIHSFWVPQLHGKMDLVPGRENTFWVTADTPGRYRGICAEFCGIQHAKMHKLVVALDRPDFDAWLQDQQAEAAEPATEQARRGREVFLQSSCVECHAVRGHTPPNDVGPDLTHLASRFTLAAGILPNNRGALGGWLLDPQSQKRGARMPPTNLSGPDLQALLDYLEALR
jgi:cytochrome c oxidase subunit 2